MLSWRERCKVIYAEVDDQGRIIYDDIEKLLKENKVKYVAVTAASNVTGYVTDVHRVAAMAHKYGAQIIVDGAQIVAHREFSMIGKTEEENIDFFVFSAHKMAAIGAVATRRGAFCAHPYVWRLTKAIDICKEEISAFNPNF